MTSSAFTFWFQDGRPGRAPRHRSALHRRPITLIVKTAFLILLLSALTACERRGDRSSSASVADARRAGILTADYVVPTNADLGRYRPIEVWVEHGDRLVVRLKGPHVDTEPRVRVQGLTDTDYRTNWSERGGPPYEIWAAPEPLPDILVLERDNLEVELQRRTK
jgi:hypothetical protein